MKADAGQVATHTYVYIQTYTYTSTYPGRGQPNRKSVDVEHYIA